MCGICVVLFCFMMKFLAFFLDLQSSCLGKESGCFTVIVFLLVLYVFSSWCKGLWSYLLVFFLYIYALLHLFVELLFVTTKQHFSFVVTYIYRHGSQILVIKVIETP